jgi:hypothetical protein
LLQAYFDLDAPTKVVAIKLIYKLMDSHHFKKRLGLSYVANLSYLLKEKNQEL